jgi:NAD(P)-dependent dehydrogenase (short-subunit alcohol dehydrogenase family)
VTKDRFEGKVVLCSGGAGGAGQSASLSFAREGASVVIVDINVTSGKALQQEITLAGGKAHFIQADVSVGKEVADAVEEALRHFGKIDILINHAGDIVVKPLLQTTEADWDWLMANNAKSVFLMTKAVLPHMLSAGKGVIVSTSSASAIVSTPYETLYCSSKAAMHQFCRAVAIEFRDRGIRSNLVCPGFIQTDHGRREMHLLHQQGVFAGESDIKAMQGRVCTPEEVASVILFLASDEASFVNGAEYFVDNGYTAI